MQTCWWCTISAFMCLRKNCAFVFSRPFAWDCEQRFLQWPSPPNEPSARLVHWLDFSNWGEVGLLTIQSLITIYLGLPFPICVWPNILVSERCNPLKCFYLPLAFTNPKTKKPSEASSRDLPWLNPPTWCSTKASEKCLDLWLCLVTIKIQSCGDMNSKHPASVLPGHGQVIFGSIINYLLFPLRWELCLVSCFVF